MLKITVEICISNKEVLNHYEIENILSVASSIDDVLRPFIEKQGWQKKIIASHEEDKYACAPYISIPGCFAAL